MPKPPVKPPLKLTKEIIRCSVADVWWTAKTEWFLGSIGYASRDEPGTCLCGHFPIIELCFLRNRENGNQAVIGNCCVKKFLKLGSEKVFDAIRRIAQDPERSVNAETIALAAGRGWISDWEHGFLKDTWRKRCLSERQKTTRVKLNKKILRYLGRLSDG